MSFVRLADQKLVSGAITLAVRPAQVTRLIVAVAQRLDPASSRHRHARPVILDDANPSATVPLEAAFPEIALVGVSLADDASHDLAGCFSCVHRFSLSRFRPSHHNPSIRH